MSAEGVKKFIAVVELCFPRPQFDGDDVRQGAWMAVMARTLGGYPDDVLGEAANRILRDRVPKRDGRFFPSPAECEESCRAALRLKQTAETPLLSYAQADIPYEDRCKLAATLMQSPLGKLARKEGWQESMFYFCIDHGRVPGGQELDQCKKIAKEAAEIREGCLRGEYEFGGAWSRYAESMVRKARELMEKTS